MQLILKTTRMAFFQNFCLGLVTVFTILGNGFIILCISLHRVLQRPSHIFIASLASTDLLLGLTVMTPRLISELIQKWIFGFRLCQVREMTRMNPERLFGRNINFAVGLWRRFLKFIGLNATNWDWVQQSKKKKLKTDFLSSLLYLFDLWWAVFEP